MLCRLIAFSGAPRRKRQITDIDVPASGAGRHGVSGQHVSTVEKPRIIDPLRTLLRDPKLELRAARVADEVMWGHLDVPARIELAYEDLQSPA